MYYIEKLQLLKHPEGGYYRETYRCATEMNVEGIEGKRNISTAIYFLLQDNEVSHFHRIKSDELWFFHDGEPLEILILEKGKLKISLLGKNIAEGESFHVVVPAGCWFASRIKCGKGFTLVSCTVAPGFDFRDFEMAEKEKLRNEYPEHKDLLEKMCY